MAERLNPRKIAEERASAGLGDLVMKEKTPYKTKVTRRKASAYGPPKKFVSYEMTPEQAAKSKLGGKKPKKEE